MSYDDRLRVLNQFLAKSDGKDKLTATIQYACMFLASADSQNIKKVQASVTAARKIFRVMRPLECITPLLLQPNFPGKDPLPIEFLTKLKSLLLAMYFGADHIVWAHQIGVLSDKARQDRWQKTSLWCWALGSVCSGMVELYYLSQLVIERKGGESDEDWRKREAGLRATLSQKQLLLIHSALQALLAAGLLQLTSMQPRTIGLIGTMTSALNCYMIMPALPTKAKAKSA